MSEFQIVVCELGGERYGLDIGAVYEIIRFRETTAVPAAPQGVDGVINLRGRIVPVVDLATRFGLPRREQTKETRIVVTGTDGMRVGLVVDGVSEVLIVSDDAVSETPAVATGCDAEYIRGIVKLSDGLVILLDLDALFRACANKVAEQAA